MQVLLNTVHHGADCKINLPKDALEKSACDMNDDNVLNDEEDYDKPIIIWKPPAVIISDIRPASLSQHLKHDVL